MKQAILILALLLTAHLCTAQYTEAIKRDATTYNEAYLAQDYDTYVDLSIEQIVKLGGGKASMISVATEQAEMYAGSNMKIESLTPEAVSEVYTSGDALHVVLGQRQVISAGDKKFTTLISYLAESLDEGKTWKFIDLTPYDQESLSLFMPGISPDVVVPSPQESVLLEE